MSLISSIAGNRVNAGLSSRNPSVACKTEQRACCKVSLLHGFKMNSKPGENISGLGAPCECLREVLAFSLTGRDGDWYSPAVPSGATSDTSQHGDVEKPHGAYCQLASDLAAKPTRTVNASAVKPAAV